MDLTDQHLVKLRNLERVLLSLLEKVDKEINQTDVEWLHLKSICEPQRTSSNVTSNGLLKQEIHDGEKFSDFNSSKQVDMIDDEAMNSLILDLAPMKHNHQSVDEEFDSD